MALSIPNAEARAVYAAEDRASAACPRPLASAREVTALVRRLEQLPAFQGNRVRVSPYMRDAYTVTHELAHALQAIVMPAMPSSTRLGHGSDFRSLHLQLLDHLDPEMARALRTEYLGGGLP
jgi:hypothetical protein